VEKVALPESPFTIQTIQLGKDRRRSNSQMASIDIKLFDLAKFDYNGDAASKQVVLHVPSPLKKRI
jgi:hypothetical protein